MKQLLGRLKEVPTAVVMIDVDFEENWILASHLVEGAKRQLLQNLKRDLHEKIAVLDLDDIEFKAFGEK